ncbi:uncharacterized protein LOC141685020 [Apium graveolens]|uniref:uncharacterized protein LOC141685020 n=1 Tax=Apium graveolens TaxID=4045 RepID=UPI003D7AAEFB
MDWSTKVIGELFLVGIVIRDQTGQFVEAEAIGIREALLWIADKGLEGFEFESDSMLTIKALRSGEKKQLEVGHVLQSCTNLLQMNSTFSVHFVSRQANKVAQELDHFSYLNDCPIVFSSPPDCVLETLLYDISV